MLTLAWSRRLNFVRQDFRDRKVNEPASYALLHKTCCLVGLGDIGVEIAHRLLPFGMRLTAVRRQPRLPVCAALRFDGISGIEEISQAVEGADYVVPMLPQTPETYHIVNAEALAGMKPGAFWWMSGAGYRSIMTHCWTRRNPAMSPVRIWEEQVCPDHPIFSQNVSATPHIAGVADSSVEVSRLQSWNTSAAMKSARARATRSIR